MFSGHHGCRKHLWAASPFVALAMKLTTFKVGSACWAKMIDTKESALHSASFYTAAIEDYAEKVTGDD